MPSENPSSATLLVVEDENDLRSLIAIALRRAGYRVYDAGDAKLACAVWQKESSNIDLLVSDILLPDGSGPEIALEFRKSRPDLKVLLMSGNTRESVVETSHIVKGGRYILKPFSIGALLESVKSALSPSEGGP